MIELLVGLAVVGLLFYLIQQIPMAAPFPVLIKVVAIVICIIIVLRAVGVYVPSLSGPILG